MINSKLTYNILPVQENSGDIDSAFQFNSSNKLIEYREGIYTNIYLDYWDELIPSDNFDIEETTTWAYSVRVEYPATLDKVIKAVEFDYYGLSEDTYQEWSESMSRNNLLKNSESDEYISLITWATDLYNINRGLSLDQAKEMVIRKITNYDNSSDVNCFYINLEPMWADKATRVGLMNSISIEKKAGKNYSTLWFNDKSIVVNCDVALEFLSQLELYAVECYNKTAEHKSIIKSMSDIEDILNYDYTVGYPDKLKISL